MASLNLISKFAQKAQAGYEAKRKFTCLTFGPSSSGKSYALKTLPAPIHIYSFDPGGSEPLYEDIQKGRITVDRFEELSYKDPQVLKSFEKAYTEEKAMGLFDYVNCVVLDSLTMYMQACMYHVLKDRKKVGEQPSKLEWGMSNTMVMKMINELMTLPCHLVLIAHEDIKDDEKRGLLTRTIVANKGIQLLVPALFTEIYYQKSDFRKGERINTFTTVPVDELISRTKIGGGALLETKEPANYSKVMKKLGFDINDKTLLKDLNVKSEETKEEKKDV